jgi:hypothetical protein
MKTETEVKNELRAWVLKTSKKVNADELTDATPLIEKRIISSLQIMDLILVIERLRGSPFDIKSLKPGAFQSIDAIYKSFFAAQSAGGSHGA